jgi:hypothetical protein
MEQLNSVCDISAKAYLQYMVLHHLVSDTRVPFEGWSCYLGRKKLQGPMRQQLVRHIFTPTARQYFIQKKLLTARSFALVNWLAVETAMSTVSSTFHIWCSKHVTGFCATSYRLHLLGRRASNKCPSCHVCIERPSHIPQCLHPSTTSIYHRKVKKLSNWLHSVDTDPILTDTIAELLIAWGSGTFALPPNDSDLRPVGLLTEQAFIGYDNFMLGIVATSLEDHQNWYYSFIGSPRSSKVWASTLAYNLLGITRACWLKRNRLLHGNSTSYLQDDKFNLLNQDVTKQMALGTDGLADDDFCLLEGGLAAILKLRTVEK